MRAVCIIPARYGSTRFPGKPLAPIQGRPMVQWVYERAQQAACFEQVIVATDDVRIAQAVQAFGGQARMTPADLPSGTDRVARVAADLPADVVVNLQGDEPLVQPRVLQRLVGLFSRKPVVQMATPIKRIERAQDLEDPNLVRVVRDSDQRALYFTRSVIPFLRDVSRRADWLQHFTFFKHIGIYAYRNEFLQLFTRMGPSALEQAEKLEQLRALENGFSIYTIETDYESISVDTPEDLERLNRQLQTEGLDKR